MIHLNRKGEKCRLRLLKSDIIKLADGLKNEEKK